MVMTISIPKLKNIDPVLVAPRIQSYPVQSPKHWPWQYYLRELEVEYNNWRRTYTTNERGMKDVNDIMQDLYPGPYRVVEKYLSDRMVIGFGLEFDDPKEETFWLLKNS
jgi:hypothetical protein